MTTKAEWLALSERCEKATGPDARIDGTIAKALNLLSPDAHFLGQDAWGLETNIWVIGGFGSYEFPDVEEYTASLDAIVMLIENELAGWEWQANGQVGLREKRHAWVYSGSQHDPVFTGRAATPALALCAAFAKAMAEKAA
jgi:hypothetical protein